MRLKTWEDALHAEFLKPVPYHRHADLLFAATCLYRITGVDPLAPWQTEGRSRAAAAKAMMAAKVPLCQGFEPCAPLFARRGDLVRVKGQWGMVALDGRHVFTVGIKLVVHPLKAATQAWRVE